MWPARTCQKPFPDQSSRISLPLPQSVIWKCGTVISLGPCKTIRRGACEPLVPSCDITMSDDENPMCRVYVPRLHASILVDIKIREITRESVKFTVVFLHLQGHFCKGTQFFFRAINGARSKDRVEQRLIVASRYSTRRQTPQHHCQLNAWRHSIGNSV